jgi:hypothetical protein
LIFQSKGTRQEIVSEIVIIDVLPGKHKSVLFHISIVISPKSFIDMLCFRVTKRAILQVILLGTEPCDLCLQVHCRRNFHQKLATKIL